jgi:predicted nucleic acid-binding protein
MAYIDTSVLVAYHFKEEERHQDTKSIVEELRKKGKQLFVSPLTKFFSNLWELTEVQTSFASKEAQ